MDGLMGPRIAASPRSRAPLGGAQQRARARRIVDGFEEAEDAGPLRRDLVLPAIVSRGDPPDDLATPAGDEQRDLRVAVPGIDRRIEQPVDVPAQRRHVPGIAAVQMGRHRDEPAAVGAPRRIQRDHLHR
jgi:hypothetical protein